MEGRLRAVASIFALLKTKWDFFHDGMEGDGPWRGTPIINYLIPYPLWELQEILIPTVPQESYFYQQQIGTQKTPH